MLEWKNSSNFAFLKYEELVGEKGNGEVNSQLNLIKKFLIIRYSEIHLGNKLFEFVGNESYGKSSTFRKGKVGNWKKTLSESDIDIFKKYINELIVSLGYEKI